MKHYCTFCGRVLTANELESYGQPALCHDCNAAINYDDPERLEYLYSLGLIGQSEYEGK